MTLFLPGKVFFQCIVTGHRQWTDDGACSKVKRVLYEYLAKTGLFPFCLNFK